MRCAFGARFAIGGEGRQIWGSLTVGTVVRQSVQAVKQNPERCSTFTTANQRGTGHGGSDKVSRSAGGESTHPCMGTRSLHPAAGRLTACDPLVVSSRPLQRPARRSAPPCAAPAPRARTCTGRSTGTAPSCGTSCRAASCSARCRCLFSSRARGRGSGGLREAVDPWAHRGRLGSRGLSQQQHRSCWGCRPLSSWPWGILRVE
mmetsp:Transcript_18033/g.56033  ORF Transcript_18033/g.56033 Transcript_18033/m.56033 type:complete len:204 (-) Transcript_18033:226-837(-)